MCPAAEPPGKDSFLFRPEVAPVFIQQYQSLSDVYNKVKAVGLPNYRGARIPLVHNLNIAEWRKHESKFIDKSLVDMLEFGFPSGHLSDEIPALGLSNHASVLRNQVQVDKFISKERGCEVIAGPFKVPPFIQWYRNNPMLTRPKRDSGDLRVILDLSTRLGCFCRGCWISSERRADSS